MLAAARLGDQISHTQQAGGLLGGMLLGAALVGAALLVVGTGGLALPAVMAVGAVLAGAAVGGSIGQMVGGTMTVPKGNIVTGAATVFVNSFGTPAARSCVDTARCDDHSVKKIATGSTTVVIEGYPAARVDDLGECSFKISKGSANVFVGGETGQCAGLEIDSEVPGWLRWTHRVVGWVGGLCLLGPAYGLRVALASVVGSEIGAHYGGELGQRYFGKWGGVVGSLIGGIIGGGIPLNPRVASVIRRIEPAPGLYSTMGVPPLRLRPASPASEALAARDPYLLFNKTHGGARPTPRGTGPNGGRLQSHHGLQQEWAKNNLNRYGYDPDLAPSVTLETGRGHPHTSISNAQNARRDARVLAGDGKWGSSLNDELNNIVSDFRAAGYSDDTIRGVLEQQYKMLDKLGAPYDRVPGF